MKQRSLIILGLLACLTLFAGFFPVSWGADRVFWIVAGEIESRTGLRVNAPSSVGLAFLPAPRLKVTGLSLADAQGNELMRAPIARIEMRILPLLAGNFEISELMLAEAQVDATRPDARETWAKLGRRIAEGGEAAMRNSDSRLIGRVIVLAGKIALPGEESNHVSGLSGLISWPRYGQPLEAWVNGAWRGEKFEARLARLLPKALTDGAASPISLAIRSGRADFMLDGEAFNDNGPTARGTISANLRGDVEDTARWLGIRLPLSTQLHDVALSGDGSIDRRRLSLSSATLSLGSSRLEGTLAIGIENDQPSVNGTLAADTIDLGDPAPLRLLNKGTWDDTPFDLDDLKHNDIDLRLSASRLIYRQVAFEDVGLSALLKSGRLEVTLGRASAFKGTLRGRLGLQLVQDGVEAKLQGNLDKIDAASALYDLAGSKRLAGTASAQFSLEGAGANMRALVGALSGKGSAILKPADVNGVNIADLARRNERKVITFSDTSAQKTGFETLNLMGTVTDGIVDLTADGMLQGTSGMRTALAGKVSLPARSYSLTGQVQPASGSRAPASLWPFEITGSLERPLLTPTLSTTLLRPSDTTGSVTR